MKGISISHFDLATVDFLTNKMLSAKTAWVNTEALSHPSFKAPDTAGDLTKLQNPDSFCDYFAYGIMGNDKFDEIVFAPSDKKLLKAERYGGVGISDNGGGVRCGNIGNFQIKGIGQNCLVGSGKDAWHAYGCLSMVEAIVETVNSVVLNRVLPLGVATCYGLIWTGQDTSCPPSESGNPETGPGALLVREACLRPAHFFRCNYYQTPERFKNKVLCDVHRTRQVNLQLEEIIGAGKEIIAQVAKFMASCAKQFAFARVHRILHGAISPSNISFDGRWLDLTTATFLDGGRNVASYQQNMPFLDEWSDVNVIMEEFFYNFGKYVRKDFNIAPLKNYYFSQYDANFAFYLPTLFGLPAGIGLNGKNNENLLVLAGAYSAILLKNKKVDFKYPEKFNDTDPVVEFIESLFLCTARKRHGTEGAEIFNCKAAKDAHINAFSHLLDERYEIEKTGYETSYSSFLVKIFIQSLRKCYFGALFYKLQILSSTRTFLKTCAPTDVALFINEFDGASKWIYGDADSLMQVVIVDSVNYKIAFNVLSDDFLFIDNLQGTKKIYLCANELASVIEMIRYQDFRVNGFSLKNGCIRLLKKMAILKSLIVG